MPESLLVAVGGNALMKPGEEGTLEEQRKNVNECLSGLLEPIQNGTRLIITHGNGPQVGYMLIRAQAAKDQAYDLPLDVCVAQSQGEIGYLIQQSLQGLIQRYDIHRTVVTILTQTLIDPKDPQFQNPTKPIGPFYQHEEARALKGRGASFVEDTQHRFRRVVPSPYPIEILETKPIEQLVDAGVIVIAAGGGGIPVYRDENGSLHGIDAIVDKDLASSILAVSLKVGRILNLTSIDHAKLNYGSSEEQDLKTVSVAQARQFSAEGHFAPGSMAPKIEAAIHFIEHGGKEFIITGTDTAQEGVDHQTGTCIFSNAQGTS